MPQELSDEEFMGQGRPSPSPAASGELSDEEFMGGSAPPKQQQQDVGHRDYSTPAASRQPATDGAMQQSQGLWSRLVQKERSLERNYLPTSVQDISANLLRESVGGIKSIAGGVVTALSQGSREPYGNIEHGGGFNFPGFESVPQKPAAQQMTEIHQALKTPLLNWTQEAPDWAARQWPVTPGNENAWYNKVARAAGGFAPVLLSGPLAPITIGAQTIGEVTEHTYNEKIKQGIPPERAAQEAFDKAMAGGATQAALWTVLPKPLKMAFDKYLIDKVGVTGFKRLLLNRGAQAAEGAGLGVATQVPTNIAMGDPVMENVGATSAGLAAAQLVFPRGRTHSEVAIERAERAKDIEAVNEFLGKNKPLTRYDPVTGEEVGEPFPAETQRVGRTEYVTPPTPEEEAAQPIEEVKTDATEKGDKSEDSIDEHTGDASGGNIPAHTTEVREGGGEPPGDSGGTGAAAAQQVEPVDIFIQRLPNGRFGIFDRNGDPNTPLETSHTLDGAQVRRDRIRDKQMKEKGVVDVDEGLSQFERELTPQEQLDKLDQKILQGGKGTSPEDLKERNRLVDLIEKQEKADRAKPKTETAKPIQAGLEAAAEQQRRKMTVAELKAAPFAKLLTTQDQAEHKALRQQWTDLDFAFGDAIRRGDEDQAWEIAAMQGELKRKLHKIEAKLPDGGVYDVGFVGAGPTGMHGALSSGAEGNKTLLLDTDESGGQSKKTPLYENITGALAQTGRERALIGKYAALRHGAEFQNISGIEGEPTYDPDTRLWTVKTKGPGNLSKTFKLRTLVASSGTKGLGATFPIHDASGNPVTRSRFVHGDLPITGTAEDKSGVKVFLNDGHSMAVEALKTMDKQKGKGGDMLGVGGANSAGQGAVDAALALMKRFLPKKEIAGLYGQDLVEAVTQNMIKRPKGAPQFHLVVRGPKPEMSGYLADKVKRLSQLGWIEFHTDREVDHVEAPSDKNGNRATAVLKHSDSKDAQGKHVKGALSGEKIPVDALGSFIGAAPVTDWLPKDVLRNKKTGAMIVNSKFQALREVPDIGPDGKQAVERDRFTGEVVLDENGKPKPLMKREVIPGLYGAGSLTEGATGRMVPSEGAGGSVMDHVGQYIHSRPGKQWIPASVKDGSPFQLQPHGAGEKGSRRHQAGSGGSTQGKRTYQCHG